MKCPNLIRTKLLILIDKETSEKLKNHKLIAFNEDEDISISFQESFSSISTNSSPNSTNSSGNEVYLQKLKSQNVYSMYDAKVLFNGKKVLKGICKSIKKIPSIKP